MYRQQSPGGCGCGGGVSGSGTAGRQRLGHIDAQGRCVCSDCEECDGLTCLCRPRFYDGQLLTAATFTKLDHYVVAKSRLHNRYLHGVGVVCGLEAVCSPCDDTVTVRPGYALGPCGEDIVVPGDATVDVAGLIRAQRQAGSRPDCPPYSEPTRDTEAARQRWVLGICYDERPGRPVAGLKRASSSCGSSCGGACGGSCGGSCGGARGGSGGAVGTGSCGCGGGCGSSASSAPSTCEPTEICEGYRFTLTKVRPGDVRRPDGVAQAQAYAAADGRASLPEVVQACLARLAQALTSVPVNPTPAQVLDYAAQLKDDLRELLATSNVHDCTLARRLGEVVIPDGGDPDALPKAQAAIVAMLQLVIELFRDCLCSALLPPCPVGCADDCVPLAVVTVRSSDLAVLDVCNWSARQFVITMPTLAYWLGWLPVFGVLRSSLERLCCTRPERPRFGVTDGLRFRAASRSQARVSTAARAGAAAGAATGEAAGEATGEATGTGATTERADDAAAAPFVALAGQYSQAWSSLSGLEATVLGALGGRSGRNQPMASETELAHPLTALTMGRVGVDALVDLLPPDLARRFVPDAAVGGQAEPAPEPEPPGPAVADRLADLEQSLTKLRRKVDTQARTIRALRAEGPQR